MKGTKSGNKIISIKWFIYIDKVMCGERPKWTNKNINAEGFIIWDKLIRHERSIHKNKIIWGKRLK